MVMEGRMAIGNFRFSIFDLGDKECVLRKELLSPWRMHWDYKRRQIEDEHENEIRIKIKIKKMRIIVRGREVTWVTWVEWLRWGLRVVGRAPGVGAGRGSRGSSWRYECRRS